MSYIPIWIDRSGTSLDYDFHEITPGQGVDYLLDSPQTRYVSPAEYKRLRELRVKIFEYHHSLQAILRAGLTHDKVANKGKVRD